ncbi:LIM/homeobox protein Lhx3 [Bulinus truncatus]|nr:LIM/homeobox protein Lhx3 [Bulinus truncatus]
MSIDMDAMIGSDTVEEKPNKQPQHEICLRLVTSSSCMGCHFIGKLSPLSRIRRCNMYQYQRRFGTKCASCDKGIPPTEVVRRAQENVYHLDYFACLMCARQLNTKDEFYLMEDRRLVCREDYEAAKARNHFMAVTYSLADSHHLPSSSLLFSHKTDLHVDPAVLNQWFGFKKQRRAKEKRLKKDAGRQRWNPYYRQMKREGEQDSSFKCRRRGAMMQGSLDGLDSASGMSVVECRGMPTASTLSYPLGPTGHDGLSWSLGLLTADRFWAPTDPQPQASDAWSTRAEREPWWDARGPASFCRTALPRGAARRRR